MVLTEPTSPPRIVRMLYLVWTSPRTGKALTLASAVVGTQREPHWKVTLLLPSEFVTMLEVIGCEPYFMQ